MQVTIQFGEEERQANLMQPIDISIPLAEGEGQVNCFYAPWMETEPVVAGDFIGSTAAGGAVNFLNVRLNPHGNGTHTECVGHIAKEPYSIHQQLRQFHFPAQLLSLYPIRQENGDRLIEKGQLAGLIHPGVEALVVRTLPNSKDKLHRNYSGANPPFFHHEAIELIVASGIRHLLVDLPSIDREEDGGKLLGHHAFWKYPETEAHQRQYCTISELVFVPDKVKDGLYLVNIQIASFEIDVSPSKPVLYATFPIS